jgi:hypothetical protein
MDAMRARIEQRATVYVRPASALTSHQRLFSALQAVLPVTFTPYPGSRGRADAAIIFTYGDRAGADATLPEGIPVFVVAATANDRREREPVQLSESPLLDRRLRGIELRDRLAEPSAAVEGTHPALAAARSGPAWTVCRGDPAPVHRLGTALTELEPRVSLWSALGERPIALLALVQFLRSLLPTVGWSAPPLRASFVFDDPNLRWRSYGFIDYRRLLAHADAHGYHAAMAMIPLDAGLAHPPTAALFARRPDRLSLLVHGNDHVRQELQAVSDPLRALAAAAQAQRRIGRFERRYRIRVDRVMAPPHGSCSAEMSRALGAAGFDAVYGHVPGAAQLRTQSPTMRWRMGEFVGGGAAIPRIPLTSSTASIAIRAFLNHPLVIYGHHQDLADGMEPLAAAASFVNRLGDVRWCTVGEIARSNAELLISGERAFARAFSRCIHLALEPQVRTLEIEPPEDLLDDASLTGWSIAGGPTLPFGERAPVWGGEQLDVRLHGHADVDPWHVAAPAWRLRPKLRRLAVEARDRAWPLAVAAGFLR